MASDLTRVKVPELVERDFSAQAAISDVHTDTRIVAAEARVAGIASPLLDVADEPYGESVRLGHDREDMAPVLAAIEARSARGHG